LWVAVIVVGYVPLAAIALAEAAANPIDGKWQGHFSCQGSDKDSSVDWRIPFILHTQPGTDYALVSAKYAYAPGQRVYFGDSILANGRADITVMAFKGSGQKTETAFTVRLYGRVNGAVINAEGDAEDGQRYFLAHCQLQLIR
jgi:hypothetical protein